MEATSVAVSTPSGMRLPAATATTAAYGSRWTAADRVLRTWISGQPSGEDVARWEDSLYEALDAAGHGPLRVAVDLTGYEVADVPWEVHRRQREVVPSFLSALGRRAGYPALASPAPGTRGAANRVVAVAHVHHDDQKVALFQTALSRPDERYFSSLADALRWLASVPLAGRGADAAAASQGGREPIFSTR